MELVVLRTVLSLGAVLALMLGLLYAVRRYTRGGGGGANLVEIELLAQRPVGPRRSVQVLRVGDRVLVVGMTEQSMQTLTELTGDAVRAIEERRQMQAPRSWTGSGAGRMARTFSAHLRSALGMRPADTGEIPS